MSTLKPEQYGAIGDGRADDTSALVASFAALASGDNLVISGTYRHSSLLTVSKSGVRITGGGRLVGTDARNCALAVAANNVTIEDIGLQIITTVRQANDESAALLIGPTGPVSGFRGRRLHLEGSGVMLRGQSYGFVLEDFLVTDSMGDGIHMTDGVHDGLVLRPTVLHAGDDGVAVVSYLKNPKPCHDIEILSPRVRNVYYGRGVTVVGGTRIRIFDVDVSQIWGAGVYIACEQGTDWQTYAPQDVTVRGGTITGANTASPGTEYGALLVVNQSKDRPITSIDVSGFVIRDTFSNFRVIGFLGGPGGGFSGCTLSDIVVIGGCPRVITQVGGGTVKISDVRVGVTQFVPHPNDTWVTNPNGQVSGAHGSTAVLLDGTYWYKLTTGDMSGWQKLSK